MNKREKSENFSFRKAVIIIFMSLVAMVLAQLTAVFLREIFLNKGRFITGNICVSITYVFLTLISLSVICKISKIPLSEMKVTKPEFKHIWIASAFIMPLIVIVCTQILPGKWIVSYISGKQLAENLTMSILFFGISVGIVEEAVFRGMVMTSLEKITSKRVAVLLPSLLFGLLHIGSGYSTLSCFQVIFAGTTVGLLFSLVTYYNGNIWSSSAMHAVWNVLMCSKILHIGSEIDNECIFNYILDNNVFLFTGGDFGIEASIFAIMAYVIFILLTVVLLKKYEKI